MINVTVLFFFSPAFVIFLFATYPGINHIYLLFYLRVEIWLHDGCADRILSMVV